MAKLPRELWDECHSTAERKARALNYEDSCVLSLQLALEKESDQHLNAYRPGGGGCGSHGKGYPGPRLGQGATPKQARIMDNVKELFRSDARDKQGHLQHALDLGASGCMVKMCPKLPLRGTAKKKFFWGDPKTQEPKIPQKAINWSIFIYFQENRLPGKQVYFSKNALRFWENHDFLFPLPLMLSNKNTHELSIFSKTSFRKPCYAQHHNKHFLAPLPCVRPRANTNTTAQ